MFVFVKVEFFRQVWIWDVKQARMIVLFSGRVRVRDFNIWNGFWDQVQHHRVGGGEGVKALRPG